MEHSRLLRASHPARSFAAAADGLNSVRQFLELGTALGVEGPDFAVTPTFKDKSDNAFRFESNS
jgi:hypothetical protein